MMYGGTLVFFSSMLHVYNGQYPPFLHHRHPHCCHGRRVASHITYLKSTPLHSLRRSDELSFLLLLSPLIYFPSSSCSLFVRMHIIPIGLAGMGVICGYCLVGPVSLFLFSSVLRATVRRMDGFEAMGFFFMCLSPVDMFHVITYAREAIRFV